jgi:type II secretory pathway pseudopilin PulG
MISGTVPRKQPVTVSGDPPLPQPPRTTNRFALAAPLFALWSIACALPAMATSWTWLLYPYAVFTVLALGCGALGWGHVARQPRRYRGRPWAGAAIAAVFAFYAGATYFTIFSHTRERAERSAAAAQMQALDASMRHYYAAHRRLPPAAISAPDGTPLLSWRVAVLPILGEQALYDRFRLDEAWDSKHNQELLAEMPSFYAAPHRPDAVPPTTVYQVFVGPGTPFDPEGTPLRLPDTDFPQPVQEVFLIVEAARAVPWTKPDDLVYAADQAVPALGSVMRYVQPPLMFVPRPGRGMLATRIGAGPHWVDLDATDSDTLRRSIDYDEHD